MTESEKSAAMALAMAGNCAHRPPATRSPEKQGCTGRTSFLREMPCLQKILSGNHPDTLLVAADGPIIKVDQVRAESARLALKPYEADNGSPLYRMRTN
ncbi:MAG: hypothetical protein R2874_01630 [Desulfobacterales bacterium]